MIMINHYVLFETGMGYFPTLNTSHTKNIRYKLDGGVYTEAPPRFGEEQGRRIGAGAHAKPIGAGNAIATSVRTLGYRSLAYYGYQMP